MKLREIFLYKDKKFGVGELIRILVICFFLFIGIIMLFTSFLSGVFSILIAVLWMPKFHQFVSSKAHLQLTRGVKAFLTIILFLLLIVASVKPSETSCGFDSACISETSKLEAQLKNTIDVKLKECFESVQGDKNFSKTSASELSFAKQRFIECSNSVENDLKEIKDSKYYPVVINQAILEEKQESMKLIIENFSEWKSYLVKFIDFMIITKQISEEGVNLQNALSVSNFCSMKNSIQKTNSDFNNLWVLLEEIKTPPKVMEEWARQQGKPMDYSQFSSMEKAFEKLPVLYGMLGDYADGMCIMQTDIIPNTDYSSSINTIHNLEDKQVALNETKQKMQSAFDKCKQIGNDPDLKTFLVQPLNCTEFYPIIQGLTTLQKAVEEGVPQYSGTFTESQMFTVIYNYYDLLKPIEPTNPNVRTIATQLANKYPGDRTIQQADIIFQYTRDEVNYIQTPLAIHQRVQTPEATLSLKSGNCADKSVLLASLLMSVGFQVRMALEDTEHSASYYQQNVVQFAPNHAYIEVMVNGQWIPADPACSPCSLGTIGFPNGSIIYLYPSPVQ